MRALTVTPGTPNSARVEDIPEPPPSDGPMLVQTLTVGVCGTDREIIQGSYGWAPQGKDRLVLGHESLGRVLEAPQGAGFNPGDLVVGIVRRPDPVPCASGAVGEFDMCRNGRYTERGIKQRDGYCSERYRIEPDYAVHVPTHLEAVGVLVEPASVVAKAWAHIDSIGSRTAWKPRSVLVTGAGPIGLLAAMMGVQRGLEVHVLDRVTSGPKPEAVRSLGAAYHTSSIAAACPGADIIIECTGVGKLVLDAMEHKAPGGIVCLTGLSSGGREIRIDPADINRTMVLENSVVFGSVNANHRHYEAAVDALAKADPGWLERLITRRLPLDQWSKATELAPSDIKVVIDPSQ